MIAALEQAALELVYSRTGFGPVMQQMESAIAKPEGK